MQTFVNDGTVAVQHRYGYTRRTSRYNLILSNIISFYLTLCKVIAYYPTSSCNIVIEYIFFT